MNRPENAIDPQTITVNVKSCRRLIAHLLRATMRPSNLDKLDAHRRKNLSRELGGCLVPLVVSERSPLGFFRALCDRFQIDVADTSEDGNRWPLEVWLPEGRIRWDLLLTRVAYRDLHVVIDENPQFFATFATSMPVDAELEDQMFESYPDPVNPTASLADLSVHALPMRAYHSIWTCLEPVSHGADGKSGNVTMFRRERSVDLLTGKVVLTPMFAGNAVRGQMRDLLFRRALALVGLDALDLPPTLSHAFFSGGSIEAGAQTNTVDMTIERTAREMFPAWDLFAGCLDNRAMRGRMGVHDGVLVCRENAWRVHPQMAPAMPLQEYAESLHEASALTQLRLGTRHAHKELPESDGEQMIFNTEVVMAGAKWLHSFQVGAGVTRMSPITLSCLSDLLVEFASIGCIGAQTSKIGHIDVSEYVPGADAPPLPKPTAYIEYMKSNAEAIRVWLKNGGRVSASSTVSAAPAVSGKGKGKAKKLTAEEVKAVDEIDQLHMQGTL